MDQHDRGPSAPLAGMDRTTVGRLYVMHELSPNHRSLNGAQRGGLQPLFLNTLSGGGTWQENNVTEAQVMERYGPTIARGAPTLWTEAAKLVREHFADLEQGHTVGWRDSGSRHSALAVGWGAYRGTTTRNSRSERCYEVNASITKISSNTEVVCALTLARAVAIARGQKLRADDGYYREYLAHVVAGRRRTAAMTLPSIATRPAPISANPKKAVGCMWLAKDKAAKQEGADRQQECHQ